MMINKKIMFSLLVISLFLVSCASDSVEAFKSETQPMHTKDVTTVTQQASSTHTLEPTGTRLTSPQSTQTATLTRTKTPTSTVSISPTATSLPELPEEHYIKYVYGHKQYFPLGCEASVAVDWAAYFGVEINEFEFQLSLPLSDNPDFGFVGGVDGPWGQVPPYSYGVHAAPVAELLQEYGLSALGVKEYTLEELKRQIAQDKPVIAWVIGNVVGGIPYEYADSQGNKTIVAAYEHVVIVVGYDQQMIRYNNNGKIYEIPVEIFENSWSVLGNMVVVMAD